VIKATLGIVGAAAIVVLAASYGQVSAQPAPKPPACKTLTDEYACKGRDDCQWVAASGKRKAACKVAPKKKK
jgi:hypothetical protein